MSRTTARAGIRACAWVFTCALAALLLSACAPGVGGAMSSATGPSSAEPAVAANTLAGVLHGGQSPIVGATVTLYEAGVTGTADATAQMLGQPQTTNSLGEFSFSNVTAGGLCGSTGALLYVVASGGSAGPGGSPNSAINLMAAVGACNSLPSYVVINELTTVAAVYALNGFAYQNSGASGGAGSLNGCVDCTPSSTNMTELNGSARGITNAFANAALLADVTSGNPASSLPSATTCAGSPAISVSTLNCPALDALTALANSLAACVNSTSAGSSQCVDLFECAVPGAAVNEDDPTECTPPSGSELPADTLSATLSIARNPGLVSTSGIWNIAAEQVVFSPGLVSAPNDWTLPLSFTGGGQISSPGAIAIDASGDVWIANTYIDGNHGDSITELSPTGTPLTPSGGLTAGGNTAEPVAIAIDAAGNVWVSNLDYGGGSSNVAELSPQGSSWSYQTFSLINPGAIAIDPLGNAWVLEASDTADVIDEIDPSGTVSNFNFGGGSSGDLGSPAGPGYVAIDATGDVWVASNYGSAVFKLSSSGVPESSFNGTGEIQITQPNSIAVAPGGNVWVAYADSVSELSPTSGTLLITAAYTGGTTGGGLINGTGPIAVDAGGTVWVVNKPGESSVTEIGPSGTPMSPVQGFKGGGILDVPTSIAVDPSGDVWISSSYTYNVGGTVTELIGVAMPTLTPLAAQITPGP